MSDLISKQAVLELIEHLDVDFANSFDPHTLTEIYRCVKEIPSAENKGEWIAQDIHNCHTNFKCSECGYIHSFMHLYGEPTADYTYCPNCGADMRGET